jgi:hypothetical protein
MAINYEDQYRKYTEGAKGANAPIMTYDQWTQKTGLGKQPSINDTLNSFVVMQTPFGPEQVRTSDIGNFEGKQGYSVLSTDSAEAMKLGNVGSPEWQDTFTKYGGDVSKFGQPSVSPLPSVTQSQATTDTQASTVEQMADIQKQQAVDAFKRAFENTKGALEQEGSLLEQTRREEFGQIGTDEAMSRAATEKSLAGLGLSGAGAVGQADIAQNVITGGAKSALSQQYSNAKADINRRLSEAQSLMEQGIADATTQAEMVKLEQQLIALQQAEATALAKEEQAKADYLATIGRFYGTEQAEIDRILNDGDPSNDWQVPFLQAQQAQSSVAQSDQAMNQWLNTAKAQFYNDYDAEIQRLQASGDPMAQQKIAYLQGWRNEKIANLGLDQQGNVIEQGLTYTVPQALEATRQGFWNQQIADALGLDFNTGRPTTGVTGGGAVSGTTTIEPPTITSNIDYNQKYDQLRDDVTSIRTQAPDGSFDLRTRDIDSQIDYIMQNEDALKQKYGVEPVDDYFASLFYEEPTVEQTPIDADPYIEQIESLYVQPAQAAKYDSEGDLIVAYQPAQTDVDAIKNYLTQLVLGGEIDQQTADSIALLYNLPIE